MPGKPTNGPENEASRAQEHVDASDATENPGVNWLTRMAKKLKNEKALLREALALVLDDAVKRGIVEFDATDSHDLKIQYAYRLLVHDKSISPLPQDQESLPNIKHRLAMWVTHQLAADHELLK